MKKFGFGLLTATLALSSSAMAADVFVRQARGSDLSRKQIAEVTNLVRNAVGGMSEHQLVNRASDADFVLQPSVLSRGDEMVLRIEKVKDGEILAMSEETINSFDASRTRAMAVTETALQDDSYATDDDGTASAVTTGADDSDAYSSQGAIDTTNTNTSGSANLSQQSAGGNTGYTPSNGAGSASVGELTAASPRFQDPNRAGQFQLGVGPSFGIGMNNDNIMYDILLAYAVDLSDTFVAKGFGDLNFATGSESSRFLNFGVAGEYYPTRELLTFGKPYLGADLGYAFVRDAQSNNTDNLAVGAAAGFKFQASELNWDVNAHYTILLDDLNGDTPNVLGVRVALGF
jgi:hypothetical protein